MPQTPVTLPPFRDPRITWAAGLSLFAALAHG